MQLVDDIHAYIERLRVDYVLHITLHPFDKEILISESSLMKYNFHDAGFCLHLKTNQALLGKCIAKQEKIREKLRSVPAFTGVCHAGVRERIYGFYLDEKPLGFISVSGYKAEPQTVAPRLDRVSEEFGFTHQELRELYERLNDTFPVERTLDGLLFPLCRMLEYGNLLLRSSRRSDGLYTNILYYLANHYTENVSVKEIAAQFFVSHSQVSHTFKKNNGKSIREYTAFLRLEYAKKLLEYTRNGITDIAMTCGFFDCSYFCNQFKKTEGISPKQYRANCKRQATKTDDFRQKL